MKKMMRKLPVLILLIGVLTLTGCSSQETFENEAYYQSISDQYVEMLASMDADTVNEYIDYYENGVDLEQYISLYPFIYSSAGESFPFTSDAFLSMFRSYSSNMEELGTYIGLKEYEGGSMNEDGEITYSSVYEFSEHDMRLQLEFDANDVIVTVTMDPIYSYGEIAQKAAMNTLIGMGTVFVVLILLCFLISLFKYIPALEEKLAGKKKETKTEVKTESRKASAAPASAPRTVAETAAPQAQTMDDTQLIAVITAAIAAQSGTPTDGFVVRSIKRRANNKWKRA